MSISELKIIPIGIVRSSRGDIKDDFWGNVISQIEINHPSFDKTALYGLKDFSHVEVIYYMHKVGPGKIIFGARHPRNDKNLPF